MPKAKSVLVYTMTPRLAGELQLLRLMVTSHGFTMEEAYVQAVKVVGTLDAQTVTVEKGKGKR